jgi:hypothetical protein
MWPVVRRAIGFVLDLQLPRGEILWQRTADGAPARYALLTGCSSTYQSLLCAAWLARLAGEPQPRWEQAARRLGHVVASHPAAFADKSRFSMDWYYPVLAGPVRGLAARARLDAGWAEFVVPGLGVRCVRDEPWVTGAETCELVMALEATGDRARALAVFGEVQHLRDSDGGYWTGWQYANQAHFPDERSSWTAAAMILAADTLSRTTPGSSLFRDLPAAASRLGPDGRGTNGARASSAGGDGARDDGAGAESARGDSAGANGAGSDSARGDSAGTSNAGPNGGGGDDGFAPCGCPGQEGAPAGEDVAALE